MMSKYRRFVKDKDSKMQPYLIVWIWLLVFLLLFALVLYLRHFIKLDDVFNVIQIVVAVLLLCSVFLEWYLFKNREVKAVFDIPEMTKKANKMSVKLLKLFTDVKVIEVLKFANKTKYGFEMPVILSFFEDDLTSGFIAFENIANFEVMDKNKYEQKISGLLNGRFQKYSIVSSELVNSDSFMLFHFEDTTTSQRFIVKNNDFSEFVSDNIHHIRLSKDLVWFSDISPHFAIIARTRGGKTYLCKFMAEVMLLQNWTVEFHSTKLDKQVKKYGGCYEALDIVARAEYYVSVMNERLKIINESGHEKYLELDEMNDIGLFFDEIGNLNASLKTLGKSYYERWVNAINKLSATGASAGIHLICCSQQATIDGFVPSLTRDNISDCVIMLAGSADSADERRYMMSGYADMPKRNYKQGTGLARLITSGKKWQAPHYFECPWFDE